MSEFQIVELNPGNVSTNFDAVKADLEQSLELYRNVEVTEESLPVCKELKRNLSAQSKDIDTFRKTVKKELSAPITEFEARCKELQGLISEVITPIDEGIKEFDEKSRQEKLELARNLIREIAEQYDFPDIERIEVKPSWGNVTTTKKAIKEDILQQIRDCQERDRELERRTATFQTIIDLENESLKTKMDICDFSYLISGEEDDSVIIRAIKERSKLISTAESEAVKEITDKQEKTPEIEDLGANKATEQGYCIRIFDEPETADDVLSLLKENGYLAMVE